MKAEAELADRCSLEQATWAVKLILGSYPTRKVANPDVYVQQLAALLSSYPTWLVKDLANPKTGVVSRSPFLPTLSEIGRFAEARLAQKFEVVKRYRDEQKRLDDCRQDDEIPDEERKAMADRLRKLAAEMRARPYLGPSRHASEDAELEDRETERRKRERKAAEDERWAADRATARRRMAEALEGEHG